jgi:hypothetical protein
VTGLVVGVTGDRLAVRLKVIVALVQASAVTVGAAVTAWAVILQERAAR